MNRRTFLLTPSALQFISQDPVKVFLFESDEAEVRLVADPEHRGTYVPMVRVKRQYDADEIILVIFYKTMLSVNSMGEVLLSVVSVVPYAGVEAYCVGDAVPLPRKPEFVRLKLLKSVAVLEIRDAKIASG